MKIKIDLTRSYAILTLFVLFVASDTIYVKIYPDFDDILKLVALMFSIYPFLIMIKRKNGRFILLLLLACLGVMSFWSIVNTMPIKSTFGIWIRFCGIFYFIYWCKYRSLNYLDYVFEIIICLSVVCLIFWFFFEVGISGVEGNYIFIPGKSVPYISYSGIYYRWGQQFIRTVLGIKVHSTNGIWSEPGAYQIFPNFALFYGLFVKENVAKYKLVILTMAVFSSASAMGVIILIILWSLKLINSIKYKLFVIIPCGIGVYSLLVNLILEKQQTTNWDDRILNLNESIGKVLSSPFWGTGMSSEIWSGIFNYFINYGILGVMPIFVVLIGIRNRVFGKMSYTYAAFCVWWLLSMLNEALGYNNLIFIVYAACLVERNCINKRFKVKYEKVGIS